VGSKSFPLLVNFGPGVSPLQGQKVKNWWCFGRSLARCDKLAGQSPTTCDKLATTGLVSAISMWGYMPVRITGILDYVSVGLRWLEHRLDV